MSGSHTGSSTWKTETLPDEREQTRHANALHTGRDRCNHSTKGGHLLVWVGQIGSVQQMWIGCVRDERFRHVAQEQLERTGGQVDRIRKNIKVHLDTW
jgi:hypothetical protein